jgi:hypothetical protein
MAKAFQHWLHVILRSAWGQCLPLTSPKVSWRWRGLLTSLKPQAKRGTSLFWPFTWFIYLIGDGAKEVIISLTKTFVWGLYTVKSLLFVGHEFSWFSWVGQSTNLRSDEIISQQILLYPVSVLYIVNMRLLFSGRFSWNGCIYIQCRYRLNPFAILKKTWNKTRFYVRNLLSQMSVAYTHLIVVRIFDIIE